MQNQQHTPGPWIVNDWSSSGWSVRSKIGMPIASKRWGNELTGQEYRDEMIANAHLIAAAPDMLDALRHVYARLEIEESENPGGAYILAAMRENIANVIRKATGKDIE